MHHLHQRHAQAAHASASASTCRRSHAARTHCCHHSGTNTTSSSGTSSSSWQQQPLAAAWGPCAHGTTVPSRAQQLQHQAGTRRQRRLPLPPLRASAPDDPTAAADLSLAELRAQLEAAVASEDYAAAARLRDELQ
jgi:hypothetical protein